MPLAAAAAATAWLDQEPVFSLDLNVDDDVLNVLAETCASLDGTCWKLGGNER